MKITANLGLRKPDGSDVVNIDDINYNSDKIDLEFNKIKNTVENIDTTAENTMIKDVNNHFNSPNVEGALEELFQCGVNSKNKVVQAINSKITVPDLNSNNSWDEISNSIRNIKEGRGNAQVSQVLQGSTFTNDSGQLLTGTMPNRGGAQTITPGPINKTLENGYYGGDITIIGDSDLKPENIKQGINIFGVTGNMPIIINKVVPRLFITKTVSGNGVFQEIDINTGIVIKTSTRSSWEDNKIFTLSKEKVKIQYIVSTSRIDELDADFNPSRSNIYTNSELLKNCNTNSFYDGNKDRIFIDGYVNDVLYEFNNEYVIIKSFPNSEITAPTGAIDGNRLRMFSYKEFNKEIYEINPDTHATIKTMTIDSTVNDICAYNDGNKLVLLVTTSKIREFDPNSLEPIKDILPNIKKMAIGIEKNIIFNNKEYTYK